MMFRLMASAKKFLDRLERFIDTHLEEAALWVFDNKGKMLLTDGIIVYALWSAGLGSWALWAHILLAQNWAFTYVSRARNSGSLTRHMKAGFFSNYVWWLSQIIIFSKLYDYLQGRNGTALAVLVGLYYTTFTLIGSILSHAQALRTEGGKTAVGASKRYAQIPIEEWQRVKAIIETLEVNVVSGVVRSNKSLR